MLHVVQLVLPLYLHERETAPADHLHAIVKAELTRHFGRCTAHHRCPAGGRWQEGGQGLRDEMVIYEVMAHGLDAAWWDRYQEVLETRFCQIEVTIRVLPLMSMVEAQGEVTEVTEVKRGK
jgi:hypothetical protein